MSYEQYGRVPDHWLLLDGSVMKDRPVERTPAGRRVRIAGRDDSVPASELNNLLLKDAVRRAERQGTRVLYRLGPDPNDPELETTLIQRQVSSIRAREHFLPFQENLTSCDASWLFRHPSLPVFARIKLETIPRPQYGPPSATVSIHLPDLSQLPTDASWLSKQPRMWRKGDHLGRHMLPFEDTIIEAFERNPVTFEQRTFTNAEAVMEYAIAAYRAIDGIQQVTIPDLRGIIYESKEDAGHVGFMTLDFDRALQPDSYLGEMVEYAETIKPATEMMEHWNSMVALLRRRGVRINKVKLDQTLSILLGTGDSLPVALSPYKATAGRLSTDQDHKVTLDLYQGVVHVACTRHHPAPSAQDLLAYEIAQERAAITGETDLLAAFMASIEGVHQDQEAQQVIRAARHT